MTAYYNEIDPYCAEWLRNLIKEGLIADGPVDTRSIAAVAPSDLGSFAQCHFFAGIGGWSAALRLAGIADDRPLWTGSCPCQPFSLAGKQKGFKDERHLWPVWRDLIEQCRPAIVLGEQVASASQWLGLVRGDLEALGYAVGAIPIEAASAGADHLRDRYWFVASDMGNTGRSGLALGSVAEVEQGNIWCEGSPPATPSHRSFTVADSNQSCAREERQQRSGEQRRAGGDTEPRDCGDVADALCNGAGDAARSCDRAQGPSVGIHGHASRASAASRDDGPDFDWVIGADGKARRVKSGIRLLAHGVPARVAKLRALGNAIDVRPAAAFIKAALY
jgi:DNA (cytosine-5)-methyltransferase 1